MNENALEGALKALWESGRIGDPSDVAIESLRNILSANGPGFAADRIAWWLAEKARSVNEISVVATGLSWVGGGTRSVEQTLISIIRGASHEIVVTAYSLTSGSSRVIDAFVAAVSTGVRCVFIINRFDEQRVAARSRLSDLVARYPGLVRVYSFEDSASEGLHAKVVVVDRTVALVGSANLSFHGLTASHEMGLLIRGPAAAAVGDAIDRLMESPYLRSNLH